MRKKSVIATRNKPKRRELRGRLAKQLVASNYPLPGNTLEERLEILQIALIYNRAKVFDPLYSRTSSTQNSNAGWSVPSSSSGGAVKPSISLVRWGACDVTSLVI